MQGEELRQLLCRLGVRGPVVAVGHGSGCHVARRLAQVHPPRSGAAPAGLARREAEGTSSGTREGAGADFEVVGLVLVEPFTEGVEAAHEAIAPHIKDALRSR